MKKKRVILISIMIVVALIATLLLFIFLKDNKKELFIHSYTNNAWGKTDYGYIIYDDGTISEYDNCDNSRELKSSKISNKELKKLKNLANSVKNNLEEDDRMYIYDAGVTTDKIYNSENEEWVIIYKFDVTIQENNSEEALEINELINDISKKYLNQ